MKGSAINTWRIERSSSEPNSQKAISSAANGLGARLSISAVPAAASEDMAKPARIRTSRLERGPATTRRRPTETKAPAIAASGSAKERASTRPKEITVTAPNAAAEGAPKREGEASGLRRSPCKAAPESPSVRPIERPRIALGSLMSMTIIPAAFDPCPNRAAKTADG